MKSSFILFACLMLLAGGVAAQISVGPELSGQINTYATKSQGESKMSDLRGGFRAGEKADIPLSGNFHFQTGAIYVQNHYGASLGVGGGALGMTINTLQIPMYLVYKIKSGSVTSPFFSVGPYVGINAWGRTNSSGGTYPYETTETRTLKIGSASNDDIKMLDAGISANLGLQVSKGLYALMFFQKGFVNLQPQGNAENYMKSYNLGISLGFFCHCHHMCKAKVQG